MRSARTAAVGLVLTALMAACVVPEGAPVDECGGEWRDVEPVIESDAEESAAPVPIDCMRAVDERRVLVGFTMPPGPSCHGLAEVRVVEAADSVSITLAVAPTEDPHAGACPAQSVRTVTEVDLQAPVADRRLLDGSVPDETDGESEPPLEVPSPAASELSSEGP